MPLSDRFRRAIRSERSSSGSDSNSSSRAQTMTNTPGTSGAATPTASRQTSNTNTPTITLTKTNTTSHRLSLSKTLTWSRDKRSKEEKQAEKQQKRLDYWAEKDRNEWSTPEDGWRRSGNKRSKKHQDMLRTFQFDCSERRRSVSSWISGISPGQSRVGSVDKVEGGPLALKPRGSSSAPAKESSSLSREVTRED